MKLLFLSMLFFSISVCGFCQDYSMVAASDIRYTPIAQILLKPYKSPQGRIGQNPRSALGLAISGGGSRAQYFGLGVLMEIETIKNNNSNFLNDIDFFSSVSGGGYAVENYLSLKRNGVLANFPSFFDFWKSDFHDSLPEYLYMKSRRLDVLKFRRYEKNAYGVTYPDRIDYALLHNV